MRFCELHLLYIILSVCSSCSHLCVLFCTCTQCMFISNVYTYLLMLYVAVYVCYESENISILCKSTPGVLNKKHFVGTCDLYVICFEALELRTFFMCWTVYSTYIVSDLIHVGTFICPDIDIVAYVAQICHWFTHFGVIFINIRSQNLYLDN